MMGYVLLADSLIVGFGIPIFHHPSLACPWELRVSSPKYMKKFVMLFEVPFKDGGNEEVRRISTLVTLAKVVFTIWLGAVRESLQLVIKELVPWELENVTRGGVRVDRYIPPLPKSRAGNGHHRRDNARPTVCRSDVG